ncbi:uncharacterized protein [Lepisosteus oculatus]|uniref:uncharacterized protein n=1 Tax=Lepisosteus oculatus TaxID=7918 RepID=UPI00371B597C
MWAEDDFHPTSVPCLQSYTEPEDGKTYIMYHGTTPAAAGKIKRNGFCPSEEGMLGQGVYVSRDLQKASKYPIKVPEHQRVVLKLKVNVGKVKKIDRQGHPLQKTWHKHGYDTAWVPPHCGMVKSGLEEDCVWDPRRITVISEINPRVPYPLPSSPVSGNVYIMYHGTTKEAVEPIKRNGFCPSVDGMLGQGVYMSRDLQKASRYPIEVPEQQRRVLKLKVDVGKVKKINKQGHHLQKTWHEHGYDTAWVPPHCGMVPSGLEEDCVWDPRRIKVMEVIKPSRLPPFPSFEDDEESY